MAASREDQEEHAELQPRRRPLPHPIASAQAGPSSMGGQTSGQRNEASVRFPDRLPSSREIDNARPVSLTPSSSLPIAKTVVERRRTCPGHGVVGSENDNRAESDTNELPKASPPSVHAVRIPTHRLSFDTRIGN